MTEPSRPEEAIFEQARERSNLRERAAFVAQACAGDDALRCRVLELLAAHDASQGPLDAPPPGLAVTQVSAPERPGTQIGTYKLLQQIGEGGMGVVYMAEQHEPVKRRVALKIIKPGMDSRQVIARFEAERQALSLMDHPNIAKVLDAGTTESGRPYFVMELVKGQPITQYCDEKHLTPRQRLELLLPVCQAIQHAHQKGIIHRDIKPTNILVAEYDQQPVPKVIDFGVAKATSQTLTEKTMFTGYGQIVGTLEYMSPEQAKVNQLDIDTRSDIYSLGVLLYELLTGSTPFDKQRLRSAAWDEMLRIIREEEPPKPSTRLSNLSRVGSAHQPAAQGSANANSGGHSPPYTSLASIAAQRHTEPAKLAKLVRGELDWIVMKALEKDRSRRYETANGFAQDIQHYLNDEAVVACPPSVGYRLRKFVRRNRAALSMSSVIALVVLVAVGSLGWMVRDRAAREAQIAQERANREAELKREREARLAKMSSQIESIFDEVNRLEGEQKWPEALSAARRAEAAVAGGEADAETAQRVRQRLKDLEFIDRLEQIRMESATPVDGKFNPARADRDYARSFREYGVDVEELAVEMSIDRLKAHRALAIPLAAALDDWVYARRQFSDRDAARWKRLVAVARGIDPEPLRDRLRSTWGHRASEVKDELGRVSESIDVRAQHPATLVILARTLQRVQHSDAALQILRDAQYVYPGDFWLNYELGFALSKQQEYEAASRFYAAAVAIRPSSAAAHTNLGIALQFRNKLPEAIACFRKAIELGPRVANHYSNLGNALSEQKQLPEAIAAYYKASEIDGNYAPAYYNLGNALLYQKKLPEAIAAYNKAIETGGDVRAYNGLGIALFEQKKLPEAIAAYNKAFEIEPEEVIYYDNLLKAHFELGQNLRSQGKLDDAIAELRQVVALQKKKATPSAQVKYGFTLADLLNDQAWKLVTAVDPKSRDPGRAIDLAQEARELAPNDAACWKTLGVAYYRAGNWKAAVEALEKSQQPVNSHYRNDSVILFFLSMAQGRLNEQEKARTFYDQAAQRRMGIGATEEELRRFCAEAAGLLDREVPPALQDPPVLTPGPTLLKPAAGATLDNGTIDGSKAKVWEFAWSAVPGATQYHLYAIGPTAKIPLINNPALASPSFRVEDKGYVGDQNRLGYRWKVRALVNGVWTGWSEERTFDVAPLDDNQPPAPKN
jgi:serine/threonine protein kinase/tetratricopeptide (TPR) repeat protein